jgi:hypothetical protein
MNLTERHADRIEYAEDGSASFTLRKPLVTKDGEVAFLALRRPDLDDILTQDKLGGDHHDQAGWLVSRLSGAKAADVEAVDGEDVMTLVAIVSGFFDRLADGRKLYPESLMEHYAERIVRTDDDATLTLFRPLATKDGEKTEITLRRPTFKETKINKAGNLSGAAKLIATLSGIGPLTLGKIDALDGLILGEIVDSFLGRYPGTGDQ